MPTLKLIGAAAASALLILACSDDSVLRTAKACAGDACLVPEARAGKYGYVNSRHEWIIPPRFDGADAFSEGRALVLEAGRFGYIDSSGDLAIPAVFRHARAFHGGFALVRIEDQWLLINHSGRAYLYPDSAGTEPVAVTDP